MRTSAQFLTIALLASLAAPTAQAQSPHPFGYSQRPTQTQRSGDRSDRLHQEAELAMQAGNYAQAYCIWKPLAQEGDVHAQYSLGWMYHNGYGLSIDDDQAMKWWRKAADQGDADAQFALGTLYVSGDGPERDMAKAVQWFLTAAKQGHEDAQFTLRALVARGEPAARRVVIDLLADDWQILGELLEVSVAKANVRSGPGTDHAILVTLKEGHRLIELDRRGNWIEVGITGRGEIGWIYHSLVRSRLPG
jgi:TPR repeat protein